MQKPKQGFKVVFARDVEGRTEHVEWFRHADTVWITADGQETVIAPDQWERAWTELEARGFVEIFPTDRRKFAVDQVRVIDLVRKAFAGITLGDGIGLRQGQGLDDYADERTLAAYRAQDEKHDWSAIPAADLDRCYSSLSFFDADGMRFHLPAYLVAHLERRLQTADILFHLTCSAQAPVFDNLTLAQRAAVREFLQLMLSDGHNEFVHPTINEALDGYWGDR